MPFIDVNSIEPWERLPGWFGRTFHSPTMTLAQWEFKEGAEIHSHHHPTDEVWFVIEGSLEVTIDGESQVAGPGVAAIVPRDAAHSVVALSDGRAFVADHPRREED